MKKKLAVGKLNLPKRAGPKSLSFQWPGFLLAFVIIVFLAAILHSVVGK